MAARSESSNVSKDNSNLKSTTTTLVNSGDAEQDGYIFFWKPHEPYGELGQWFPSPFVLSGKSFATAEQFMMYCKATMFKDTHMAKAILESGTSHPAEHKKMGRHVTNFNGETWDRLSMNVVVVANLCKFTQDPKLMKVLMDTGDKELVETSALDRIWGVGYAQKNALKNMKSWGSNKLGKALMIVRKVIAYRLAHGIEGPVTDVAELAELRTTVGVDELDSTEFFV